MKFNPQSIDIGVPEQNPGIIAEPLEDPVPKEKPAPSKPKKAPKREKVPA